MREDLIKVLKMLSEGKINIEKCVDLVEAIYKNKETNITNVNNYNEKMFKIYVDSSEGDNVKINIPVVVLNSILKITGKLPIKNADLEGVDLEMLAETISKAIESEILGEIVSVNSSKGDIVRIVIE
ncbi:SHOCT-like domain-containing protein [Clostridium sporogenes]